MSRVSAFMNEQFISKAPATPRARATFDISLMWVVGTLLAIGLVMVYSATIALPDSNKYAAYKQTHFLFRQAIFIGVGLFFGGVVSFISVNWWQKWARVFFIAGLILLALVLIPHIGKSVNGARRWLPLVIFNIQPSEIMKFLMVLYAADYCVRKREVMHRLVKGLVPMSIAVFVVGVLLLAEPDLGALGVIVCIAMGVLFLGGINIVWFAAIISTLFGGLVGAIMISPWRLERFLAYLDPWEKSNAAGKAYQLTHSLIAFGRGEIFGVGLGASVEKLHYLPEPHTDFLMAVIGEELGMVGATVVIALFIWIVMRAFKISRQAIDCQRPFAGLVAQGIGIWIGVQAFVNMGVNLGLLPTKGLTLPLMSYGGSGIVMNCIGMAVLLRIDYENRAKKREETEGQIVSSGGRL